MKYLTEYVDIISISYVVDKDPLLFFFFFFTLMWEDSNKGRYLRRHNIEIINKQSSYISIAQSVGAVEYANCFSAEG